MNAPDSCPRKGPLRYQGFIFDLDGVLASTDDLHFAAWKKIADQLGLPFTSEQNNALRGVSRMESLKLLLGPASKDYSAEQKDELATKKNRHYRQLLESIGPEVLLAGAVQTLTDLKAMGARLAVGSSSKNARTILGRTGLLNFFDTISDGHSVTRSKPAPDIFLHARDALELCSESCLVVEDADAGFTAARAAGMDCLFIGEHPDALYQARNLADEAVYRAFYLPYVDRKVQ